MNYDVLWVIYYIIAGVLLYEVFDVELAYVIGGIVVFELAYYIVNRETWSPVRRYIYNLMYGVGYTIPMLFFP